MQNVTVSTDNQARLHPRLVKYSGTARLRKGQGVSYDRDRGTAASIDTLRDHYVEACTAANQMWFAGVCAHNVAADADGDTRSIIIYEPGSVCEVLVGDATTIDSTRLTCSCSSGDTGFFSRAGFSGRGTARMLQTNAHVVKSLDGTAAYTGSTGSLAKTGLFANITTAEVAAGTAKVAILMGFGDSTGTEVITPGIYTITTKTSDDAAIISGAGSTDCDVAAFVFNEGENLALAYLETGDESGLQQWVNPVSNDAITVATYGYTHIAGGYTVATGNSTATLADAVFNGARKGFYCWGTLGTNDFVVTVTSGQEPFTQNVPGLVTNPTQFVTFASPAATALDVGSARMPLGSMAFDAAAEEVVLEWMGSVAATGVWMEKWRSGLGIVT